MLGWWLLLLVAVVVLEGFAGLRRREGVRAVLHAVGDETHFAVAAAAAEEFAERVAVVAAASSAASATGHVLVIGGRGRRWNTGGGVEGGSCWFGLVEEEMDGITQDGFLV